MNQRQPDRKRKKRFGLCNCGEELRKRGLIYKHRCDGTQYLAEVTCHKHRKEVIERIKRKKKNAAKLLEEQPVPLPTFVELIPEEDERDLRVDRGEENMDNNQPAEVDMSPTWGDDVQDHCCDDQITNKSDSDFSLNNSSVLQEIPQADQNSMIEENSESEEGEVDNGQETSNTSGGEVSEEVRELLQSLQDGARTFTARETIEEFCEYGDDIYDLEKVYGALSDWRRRCTPAFAPNSVESIGSRLAHLLERKIRQAAPIGHIWEDIDDESDAFTPGFFPTSKEVRALIRQLGLGFKLSVTCEHHHPSQSGDKRGQICGYQENENTTPCSCSLKIGIRSSSVQEYMRAKLLDPEFGRHIMKANERWNPDSPGVVMHEEQNLKDIFDGKFYKDTVLRYPNFFYSPNHEKLHFALFVDGFQPFEGVQYTLWAVILICLNLPHEIRMKSENLHILSLIDGPHEPSDFQQYLKPIVDEFLVLWEQGMTAYDASRQRRVLFKGMLACCIQDGRASRACSCQAEAGHYQGCRLCTLNGAQANGVHYYGHRKMLHKDHLYRVDPRFGRPIATRSIHKTHEFIMSRMKILEEHPHLEDLQGMLGVKGMSQFSRLPYFDVSRCHILCFMHSMANVGTFLCESKMEYAKSNPMTCRSVKRLEAIYFERMDKTGKGLVRKFLNAIKPNSTITANLSRFFMSSASKKKSEDEPSLAKKRAQHYKDFAVTGVLSASLVASGMPKNEASTIHRFFLLVNDLLRPELSEQDLGKIGEGIWECICELENFIGHRHMTLALHNMGHFARQVLDFGPVRETWAYGAESKLGTMKRKAFNRYLPGACIMHRQVYEESLRIIARVSSNQVEKGQGTPELPGRICPSGAGTSRAFNGSDSTRHGIMQYMMESWPEFDDVMADLGVAMSSSPWQEIDRANYLLKADYTGRKKSLIDAWPNRVQTYTSFSLNGVRFETSDSANKKTKTDNSNIVFISHGSTEALFGRIQCVAKVELEGTAEMFVGVRPYKGHGDHPYLANVPLIEDIGLDLLWIQAENIIDQVFLAPDETIPANRGKYLVLRKAKFWVANFECESASDRQECM